MKKIIALALTLTFALGLTACGPKPADGWQEEIDRGVAAVEIQDYTAAAEAFEAAITIDPLWEEAYTRLRDVYVMNGDTDSAVKTLRTAAENLENGARFADEARTLVNHKCIYITGDMHELDENGRVVKIIFTGTLDEGYHDEVQYDDSGRATKVEHYNADGELYGYDKLVYDDNGNITSKIYTKMSSGDETEYVYRYDADNCLETESYKSWLLGGGDVVNHVDKDGNMTKLELFSKEGNIDCVYIYDDEGNRESTTEYYYAGDMVMEKSLDRDDVVQQKIYRNAYSSSLDCYVDLYCDYDDGTLVSEIAYYTGTQDLVSEQYYNPDGSEAYDVAHNDQDVIIVQ